MTYQTIKEKKLPIIYLLISMPTYIVICFSVLSPKEFLQIKP
jgi:hypothetical protein